MRLQHGPMGQLYASVTQPMIYMVILERDVCVSEMQSMKTGIPTGQLFSEVTCHHVWPGPDGVPCP